MHLAVKQLLKPGHVVPQSSRSSLDIQLQSMMEENMCRYMLQRIWLDTSSVEFVATRTYRGHGKDDERDQEFVNR